MFETNVQSLDASSQAEFFRLLFLEEDDFQGNNVLEKKGYRGNAIVGSNDPRALLSYVHIETPILVGFWEHLAPKAQTSELHASAWQVRHSFLPGFHRSQQTDQYLMWLPPDPQSELPKDLIDALEDLRNTPEEALEEGFPIPSPELVNNAEYLLRSLFKAWPHRFEVYPMPDGEIAIDAPNRCDSSVLVLCESEGKALCLVHIKGEHQSKRYPSIENLPDTFLRKALSSLFQETG